MDDELIPTRQSLLSRLKDWEDWASWQDFFHTYWRLIYRTARAAGLNSNEAEEIVQETLISISKAIRGFEYDANKGSFKGWLRTNTVWRIRDHLRAKQRDRLVPTDAFTLEANGPPGEDLIAHNWDSDWEENLAEAALERVKRKVAPNQFQIFDLVTVKAWPPSKIASTFRVSTGYVYLVKHRVTALLRAELKKLESAYCRPRV